MVTRAGEDGSGVTRSLATRWGVVFGVLLLAFAGTVVTLNSTLYSAAGFVSSYLDALSRHDMEGALALPGVEHPAEALPDLLVPDAMGPLRSYSLVSDEGVGPGLEADELRELAGALAHLAVDGSAHHPQVPVAGSEHGEVEVVLHRQPEEQPRLLVGPPHAEPRAAGGRDLRDVVPVELDRARGLRDVAGDEVEERGLPGAVRPQEAAALAGRDVEIDVAHGVQTAEPPPDPAQAQDRGGRLCHCVRHVTL